MSAFGAAAAVSAAPHNPNNDILLAEPPSDTVQSLAFSPAALGPKQYLVSASWDAEVRCWDVQSNGTSTPVGMIKHDKAVLDVAWSSDGQAVFSSSADKTVKMWQLGTNAQSVIAAHDAPIRHVYYSPDMGNGSPCIVTGSWDKTVKYWDVRAPSGSPMGTIPLPDKVFCMDVRSPLMVVGTADRQIRVFDIRKPTAPFHEKITQLKHQFRCLATFTDRLGYAVGSIEGRVSIDHIQEAHRKNDFSFKCHRDADTGIIYAVNSISFHEEYGTFATAGADGGFNFWDKDNKHRLKQFQRLNQPITATAFSADGSIFAYAVGYDWSKGAEYNDPTLRKYILLHGVQAGEIKEKKSSKPGRR
jgi:mRNA export factor